MATATLIEAIESTANVEDYSFAQYTPAGADEILVVLVSISASAVSLTCDDSGQGLTWTRRQDVTVAPDKLAVFTAVTTSATALTATVHSPADAGSGSSQVLYKVLDGDAASPVVQSANGSWAANGTPTITFGAAVDTGNVVILFGANGQSPAALTAPTNYTEDHDDGRSLPTRGSWSGHRDSGETNTTINWGATSTVAGTSLGIEIKTEAAAALTMSVGHILVGF